MKRTERHHLKDNELAKMATSARHMIVERRSQFTSMAIAAVVALALVVGYLAWTGRTSGRAHTLLAEAMAIDDARVGPPPAPGSPSPGGLSFETARAKHEASVAKFKIVADEYPSTDTGRFAAYRLGATYMALGDPANAVKAYQQAIDGAPDTLQGQVARLGLAEAQARMGQYDQAIATFKLADRQDSQVPLDGVLLRLGRTYLDAGKISEAEQTFNRIVAEFPDSPFGADARRELDQLKKT